MRSGFLPRDMDVSSVFDELSDITLSELKAIGLTAADAKTYFLSERPSVFAFGLFDDETCIALFWYDPSSVNPATYFLATRRYFERYASSTKACRDFLKKHPRRDLRVHVLSQHPMAERWIRALGFHPVSVGLFALSE